MKLYVLRLGECHLDEKWIAPGVADGTELHLPIMSYLIELDDGQLLMVDTGMNRSHIGTTPGSSDAPRASARVKDLVVRMQAEDYLPTRLAELDLLPSQIKHVINTHLHFDHAGNNGLLTGATFYLQRNHYEMAKDNPVFPNEYWNIPELKYELLDGECELFPGVSIITSPGHAPGHQSVLVRLPKTGSLILCGDAIFCQDQLDHDVWSSHADPHLAQSSAHRLEAIAQREGATLIFGHDPDQGASLRCPPFYYD